MSKRAKTASFIVELPLSPTPGQSKVIRAHLEAGRNLYNALLSEANKRLKHLKSSPEWQAAKAIAKTPLCKAQRQAAFKEAREKYEFSEYALHHFATMARSSWIAEHLDANTAQTLATRAFRAVERVAIGRAKKVRFRSRGRGLDSLEGKTNKQGLRFVLDKSAEGNQGWLVWGQLKVAALMDWQDPAIRHGLACRIKYVRLVRRKASSPRAKGADYTSHRYYAQLVVEGQPYQKPKNKPGNAIIGLDLGPSTIAAVSQEGQVARLQQLCAELAPNVAVKRRLQRKLDRQRRANNPANFNEKGRIKPPGKSKKHLFWHDSQGYKNTRQRWATADRKLAAYRKSLHGRLANELVRAGNIIKTEKVSYKGWQKQFGKSVGVRAPGKFIEIMKRTVARTGGTFVEFATLSTKLSQLCHACGKLEKKPLSQRTHLCECGVGPVQRDLYSAWLASFVDPETNSLSATHCQAQWAGVEVRLGAVADNLKQRAKEGEVFPRSMGVPRAGARLPESLIPTNAKNLIPARE
jgi:transposase